VERRALLAIALSVGVLLLWQVLFTPPAPPPPPPAPATPAPPAGAPGAPAGAPAKESAPAPALSPRSAGGEAVPPVATVTTPGYTAQFGADGGVTSWVLAYRGAKSLAVGRGLPPLTIGYTAAGGTPEVVALRPEGSGLTLTSGSPRGELAFTGIASDGARIRKTLEFSADTSWITVRIQVAGLAPESRAATVALYWTGPVSEPWGKPDAPLVTSGPGPDGQQLLGRILVAPSAGARPVVFEAPAPALKERKDPAAPPELKDPHLVPTEVLASGDGWVALENDYFIVALIGGEGARSLRGRDRDLAQAALVYPGVQWAAGRPWEARARLYLGPKEWERLKAVGVGLEEAQARNYGDLLWLPWFPMWWFCVPLLWLMNYLGTHVPGQNYGVAIILLTVLVKVAFYPLTHKSMTSMKQMQGLQPQLNALRSKYRSDPQRFQREQMDLFRKHRVNPMGGCLPMIVQIPIFYALYLTLQYSVELQGAPFVGWIHDLSKRDPYYVLPILMGASMLIQQKMTPTVGDPRQARIMLIMPVIFTFMFLEFPTGLVLYWLVNNVLSIGQQMVIDRTALRAKTAADDGGRPEREGRRG
jgi:YidC/Oxa1 family membrane protein insertase